MRTRSNRRAGLLGVLAGFVLAATGPSWAQSQPDQEAAAIRQKIQALLQEQEALARAGKQDAAERRGREAVELKQRLVHADQPHAERAVNRELLTGVLDALERGIGAARAAGREEDLRVLERVADAVRRELKQGAHPAEAAAGPDAARRRLAAMKAASDVLRKAERPDGAEMMARAARAQAMDLEGRDDAESRAFREKAPNLPQRVELMAHAAELANQMGDLERSGMIGAAARELRAEWEHSEQSKQARPKQERQAAQKDADRDDEEGDDEEEGEEAGEGEHMAHAAPEPVRRPRAAGAQEQAELPAAAHRRAAAEERPDDPAPPPPPRPRGAVPPPPPPPPAPPTARRAAPTQAESPMRPAQQMLERLGRLEERVTRMEHMLQRLANAIRERQ